MKQIAEKLWQGGTLLGGEIPEEVKVIFWMLEEPTPAFQGIVVRYPIPDDDKGLDVTVFLRLLGLVNHCAELPLLAVCQAGENRSGLVCAMTLIMRGMEVEEAIKTVQKNGNANTHAHSFWNPGFVRQVRKWLTRE